MPFTIVKIGTSIIILYGKGSFFSFKSKKWSRGSKMEKWQSLKLNWDWKMTTTSLIYCNYSSWMHWNQAINSQFTVKELPRALLHDALVCFCLTQEKLFHRMFRNKFGWFVFFIGLKNGEVWMSLVKHWTIIQYGDIVKNWNFARRARWMERWCTLRRPFSFSWKETREASNVWRDHPSWKQVLWSLSYFRAAGVDCPTHINSIHLNIHPCGEWQ